MRKLNLNLLMASSVLVAGLAACGGGGGGSTGGVVVAPVPSGPVVAATVPIVTSVPVPTYAAGSREKLAFDEYNAAVSHCGFGMRKQDLKLDAAAYGQANWIAINHVTGHYQTPGTAGFTGQWPADRIAAAGYSASMSGEDSVAAYPNQFGMGSTGVAGLLNAPYHALSMLRGAIDVGISSLSYGGNGAIVTVLNLGVKLGDAQQAATPGSVRTFPCEGSVGVSPSMWGEAPSPYPGRDLTFLPVGVSVPVVVYEGHLLAISTATMIEVSTGNNVPLLPPVVAANDPNPNYLLPNEGYVTAASPQKPLSAYQVSITGTDNGVAFSRTFKFTTGI